MPLWTIFTECLRRSGPQCREALLRRCWLGGLRPDVAGRGRGARRERLEKIGSSRSTCRFAADHQAIAALADRRRRRSCRRRGNASLRAARSAPRRNVVVIVRVAAVDHDVARLEQRHEFFERAVDHRGGHHHQHGARLVEPGHEVFERRRARHALRASRSTAAGL